MVDSQLSTERQAYRALMRSSFIFLEATGGCVAGTRSPLTAACLLRLFNNLSLPKIRSSDRPLNQVLLRRDG